MLKDYVKNNTPLRDFVFSRLQLCYGDRFEKKLVKTLTDQSGYSTFYNCGTRITEFGYDYFPVDSLLNGLNVQGVVSVLRNCDTTQFLDAVYNYNDKLLINAINSRVPQGSTFIGSTACSHFQLTYPKPAGMTCINYLAQVVPQSAFLAYLKANYSFYVTDIANNYTATQIRELVSRYYGECDLKSCTWPRVDDATLGFDSSSLVAYTRERYWPYLTRELYNCNNDTFTKHAAYTRPYIISELFENWHYSLDSFMINVQAYYNSTVRNKIDVDTAKKVQFLMVNEWHMYGSSRLGVYQANKDTMQGVIRSYQHRVSNDTVSGNYFTLDTLKYYRFGEDSSYNLHKGRRRYEGTNHLGNVLTVFTDKRISICAADTVIYYRADVVNAYDYSAFGVILSGRKWDSDTTLKARFGFGGMERDDEVKGDGNSVDFGARVYDSRLGNFLSVDPMFRQFATQSPYVFAGNCPITFIEVLGMGPGDPPPARYSFFSEIAITVYNAAKAQGASKLGALMVVAQAANESGYGTANMTSTGNDYNLFGLMRDNSSQPSKRGTGHGALRDFSSDGGYAGCLDLYFNVKLKTRWPLILDIIKKESFTADDLNKGFYTFNYYEEPKERNKTGHNSYHGSDADGTAKNVDYGKLVFKGIATAKKLWVAALDYDISTIQAKVNNIGAQIFIVSLQIEYLKSKVPPATPFSNPTPEREKALAEIAELEKKAVALNAELETANKELKGTEELKKEIESTPVPTN